MARVAKILAQLQIVLDYPLKLQLLIRHLRDTLKVVAMKRFSLERLRCENRFPK